MFFAWPVAADGRASRGLCYSYTVAARPVITSAGTQRHATPHSILCGTGLITYVAVPCSRTGNHHRGAYHTITVLLLPAISSRLNAHGTLDITFNPGLECRITLRKRWPALDWKIIVAATSQL